MRKIIFICIVALTLFSCSTDKSQTADPLKIESVLRNGNEDVQKITYQMLNENERFIAWNNKFDSLRQGPKLNAVQNGLIEELQNNLTVSLFSDIKNDEQEYFKNVFIPHYLETIQSEFTVDEINDIFYTLKAHLLTVAPEDGPGGGDSSAKDCNCNKGSLFGCGASQSCKEKTCDDQSKGCGFLWMYECNGLCNLF